MAKFLLDFHSKFIWIAEIDPGQSLIGKRKHGTKIYVRASGKRSKKRNPRSFSAVETCHVGSTERLGEFIPGA